MPIIQRPDLVEKVRKAYEITGPDAVSTISPELAPVVIVDDLRQRQEDLERRAVGHAVVAAVAGQYSQTNLYLPPAATATVLKVEHALVSTSGTGVTYLTDDSTTFASAADSYRWRDRRLAGGTQARMTKGTTAGAPGGSTWGQIPVQNNVTLDLELDWYLEPGYGICFHHRVVNTTLYVVLFWKEIIV